MSQVRVELSRQRYISVSRDNIPFPITIAGYDGVVYAALTKDDALRVLRLLMEEFPLDALGAINDEP